MPVKVSEIFNLLNIKIEGSTKWGIKPNCTNKGVYVISLSDKSDSLYCLENAPINYSAIEEWMARVPDIKIDGQNTTIQKIAERLNCFWLPKETILYIGMTDGTIGDRIQDYYNHKIGNRSPHSGGQWLKTLMNINDLTVFWSSVPNPNNTEDNMLWFFNQSINNSLKIKNNNKIILPFANLEVPKKSKYFDKYTRKPHGIEPQRKARKSN